MEEGQKTVTLSNLISREKFYKEKALKIEREHIFAKEQVAALEARVRDLNNQQDARTDGASSKNEGDQGLQQKMEQLEKELAHQQEVHERREAELRVEIEDLRKGHESEGHPDSLKENEKIEGYERLLNEVQETINQKEREVIVLRKRIDTLEKRLKHREFTVQEEQSSFFKNEDISHTLEHSAISYIDHAVILHEKTCVIRGDCVIENKGSQVLDTPVVCFRINPIDVVKLKGKIQSLDIESDLLMDEDNWQWSFVQTRWSEEAMERGEIWIAPTRPIQIEPNEQVKVPDLQFVIDKTFCKHVSIECFIYFEASQIQIRAVNPIIINF